MFGLRLKRKNERSWTAAESLMPGRGRRGRRVRAVPSSTSLKQASNQNVLESIKFECLISLTSSFFLPLIESCPRLSCHRMNLSSLLQCCSSNPKERGHQSPVKLVFGLSLTLSWLLYQMFSRDSLMWDSSFLNFSTQDLKNQGKVAELVAGVCKARKNTNGQDRKERKKWRRKFDIFLIDLDEDSSSSIFLPINQPTRQSASWRSLGRPVPSPKWLAGWFDLYAFHSDYYLHIFQNKKKTQMKIRFFLRGEKEAENNRFSYQQQQQQ